MPTAIKIINGALILFTSEDLLWGNFITATGILFIIVLQLQDRDLKGVAIELPFFLMAWLILYLQHPLSKPQV